MDCSICFNKMTGDKPDYVVTTACGHLFHEKCLKDYVNRIAADNVSLPPAQRIVAMCPQCRSSKLTDTTLLRLHFSIENSVINEQLLMTRIADINIAMEKREKNQAEMFDQMKLALASITDSMKSFEYQNDLLRKENAELKGGPEIPVVVKNDSGVMKEQMKAKDYMIANLQKEVNELKNKRADTTREMNTIRHQINQLKAAAKGEKPIPSLVQQKPQSLTLKFDDFSDKLIIE